MSEIKVSVSITLPGRVLLTQAEAKQLERKKKGTSYDVMRLDVSDYHRKKREVLNIKMRKTKDCRQSINLCVDAYNYMTSKDGCTHNIKLGVWARMTRKQRLEAHLNVICKTLGGTSYTYEVFDD